MNVLRQECVGRACEIIWKSINLLGTEDCIHADAKGNGLNFR